MTRLVTSSCLATVGLLAALAVQPTASAQTKDAGSGASKTTEAITATGCLILQSTTGSPEANLNAGAATRLVLSKVVAPDATAGTTGDDTPRSAVPGAAPPDSATATTTTGPVPGRDHPASYGTERSFFIAGPRVAELERLVGKRVEITGMLDKTPDPAVAAVPPKKVAHPTAPTQTIAATAFRSVEGLCQ